MFGQPSDWDAVDLGGAARWAPALPGHGGVPVDPRALSLEGIADALASAVVGRGWRRVAVAGYSLGGRVALQLGLRHPGLVEALVLVSASAGIEDAEARRVRVELDRARANALRRDPAGFLLSWYSAPMFGYDSAGAEAAARRRMGDGIDVEAAARVLEALSPGVQPWVGDRLGALPAPCCWVAGSRDTAYVVSTRSCADGSGARHVVVPRVGHAVHLDAPEAVSAVLRESVSAGIASP